MKLEETTTVVSVAMRASVSSMLTAFTAVLVLMTPNSAEALGCNLAPNPAFEQGTTTSFDDWELYVGATGSATLSVSNYPNQLQSGARGVKVVVATKGDVNVRTTNESTGIAVDGNTDYVFSARVHSTSKATLRVIEWRTGLSPKDNFLATSSGSDPAEWEQLEATLKTQPETHHVSIRLVHHWEAGTFYWDDVMLWEHVDDERCVDVRHYIMQASPGERICQNVTGGHCRDGYKNSNNEFVIDTTNGNRDFTLHNDDFMSLDQRVGVHKNHNATGQWRCFADPGDECGNGDGTNATYPPHTMDRTMMLPVLSLDPADNEFDESEVTAAAYEIHDWEDFDVREFDPVDGTQTLVQNPTIWGRGVAFVAESESFGGDIGTVENVLVYEEEGIGTDPVGFSGGSRLERYYFVPGFGRIKQSARLDGEPPSPCSTNPNSTNCDGDYSHLISTTVFNEVRTKDFRYEVDLYWNDEDWW